MKLLVDGEMVDKVNSRLLVKRQAAEKVMAEWEALMTGAPRWWPDQGDDAHREKVRSAEKALVEEVQRRATTQTASSN